MKKGIPILLAIFISLFLVSFSSALLISPSASSTVSGTGILNATNTSLTGMLNCTFQAMSVSTLNNTFNTLAIITNITANPGSLNTTFNSKILGDSNDYQFRAICKNASDTVTSPTITGITIDNTVPQTPSSLSPSDKNLVTSAGTQTYSATVVGANTTSCTIYLGINNANFVSYAMTKAVGANTCTYSDTSILSSAQDGQYYWYVIASDGTNTSQSSTNANFIQLPGSSGGAPTSYSDIQTLKRQQALAVGNTSDSGNNGIVIIIAILAVVGVIYFAKKR